VAVLALHRVRQGWIEERTATINRLRALLTEFGIVLPNRAQHVRRGARAAATSWIRTPCRLLSFTAVALKRSP
jgi:transposase